MGFVEEEENRQDACAPVEEAIGKHLRPELVNRLTKIVHFTPLGMDAAREIVGKLLAQLNARIADRGVSVLLVASYSWLGSSVCSIAGRVGPESGVVAIGCGIMRRFSKARASVDS